MHKSKYVHVARYLETTMKLITTDIKQAVVVIPDGFCNELYCIYSFERRSLQRS